MDQATHDRDRAKSDALGFLLVVPFAAGVAMGAYGVAGLRLGAVGLIVLPIVFVAVPATWLVAARSRRMSAVSSTVMVAAVVSAAFLPSSLYFMALLGPRTYLPGLFVYALVSALIGLLYFFAMVGLAVVVGRAPGSDDGARWLKKSG